MYQCFTYIISIHSEPPNSAHLRGISASTNVFIMSAYYYTNEIIQCHVQPIFRRHEYGLGLQLGDS